MSEQEGRQPEQSTGEPADAEEAPSDGFPGEDVAPEEIDPDLDVNDPFGVGDERVPLEGGHDERTGDDGGGDGAGTG